MSDPAGLDAPGKARALYEARRTRVPIAPFTDADPSLGMAEGYAIQRELFHWESQSTQTPQQRRVRRWIEHQERGGSVLLFVREKKRSELGTRDDDRAVERRNHRGIATRQPALRAGAFHGERREHHALERPSAHARASQQPSRNARRG